MPSLHFKGKTLVENLHLSCPYWAEFVPAMQRKAVRFEVVDEEEWERKLGDVLAA